MGAPCRGPDAISCRESRYECSFLQLSGEGDAVSGATVTVVESNQVRTTTIRVADRLLASITSDNIDAQNNGDAGWMPRLNLSPMEKTIESG